MSMPNSSGLYLVNMVVPSPFIPDTSIADPSVIISIGAKVGMWEEL